MVRDTCLVAFKRKDQNPCTLHLGNPHILDLVQSHKCNNHKNMDNLKRKRT
jgi:hypothetical protein